ncbi:hypothetical protein CBG25_05560 [Arsenophonus sp. ENCA]|uniref:virB8 family protein n=1 Tax=Arsenophonus sp. ENCA TaxID=1987579 RepID=UPI000BDCADDD|nr:type IV secretion system protein [Arsenophonus sp. ENCA]PAV06570.1 hypothetical protein CBG25_05560 [Arsenophonus sp. ENCA]
MVKNREQDVFFEQSKKIASKNAKEKEQDKQTEKRIFAAVKAFEHDRSTEFKKSLKTTRLLLGGASLLCVLLGVAIACLAPLKRVEPFLLRVDNASGYVDVVKPFTTETVMYDEIISRFFLSRFVSNREAYDWFTIQNMSDNVELMASNAVFSEYNNMITGDFSPLKKLKKANRILVRVKSVTFLDENTAQVRFVKAITDNDGKPTTGYVPTSWIATIKFIYNGKKIKTELQRQINPFGLEVLSYQVDPEVSKNVAN